jgi:hypothetical protein
MEEEERGWIRVTLTNQNLYLRCHGCVFIWKRCESLDICVDSHLSVAHHFTHALRVSDANFIIFLTTKLEHQKTASSISNFEILMNSDVTFRVDTYSYKKTF